MKNHHAQNHHEANLRFWCCIASKYIMPNDLIKIPYLRNQHSCQTESIEREVMLLSETRIDLLERIIRLGTTATRVKWLTSRRQYNERKLFLCLIRENSWQSIGERIRIRSLCRAKRRIFLSAFVLARTISHI